MVTAETLRQINNGYQKIKKKYVVSRLLDTAKPNLFKFFFLY